MNLPYLQYFADRWRICPKEYKYSDMVVTGNNNITFWCKNCYSKKKSFMFILKLANVFLKYEYWFNYKRTSKFMSFIKIIINYGKLQQYTFLCAAEPEFSLFLNGKNNAFFGIYESINCKLNSLDFLKTLTLLCSLHMFILVNCAGIR